MVGRGGRLLLALGSLVSACATGRPAEDPDWYVPAADLEVEEAIAFTDAPYAFPAAGPGLGDLPMPPAFTTWFAPDDPPPAGCGDWAVDPSLPMEFEAMVTAHPRIYMKVDGCVPEGSFDVDSDEKYYGSFFVEDATGGVFVLGDSKVAHFDMGDRVRIRVRALKNNFDLKMVAAHDIVEVIRGPEPIHYLETTDEFGPDDVGEVRRIRGTVSDAPDTFGEFHVEGPDGQRWTVALDVELNRRGIRYEVGSRLEVTAPVIFSYSTYSLVVMKLGQVTVLDE